MALAPLLYNITFDSQTRILYFWDKAGHEIYHCEIPSPAPALPTVSMRGDFGVDNWLYAWSNSDTPRVTPISVNDITGLYEYNSGAYDTGVVYDSSKSYAVIEWYSNTYLTDKGVNGVITAVENNNYLCAKNIGSEGVLFHASRIAVCSSPSATVVTVYNSSNNPYNAFKYTLDGTDYYYVLDGTQTDWTDDLSSIGYHVPPALPTVSMSYAYPNQLWNYSVNIGAGASSVLRDQNGNALSYDSTKSYSALNYYTSTSDSSGTIDTNVSIGASGSFLALFNNGSSQITVQRVNVAVCSSSSATVITVFNSSNVAYNAFKYTSDGTDYYYVLDGTQTDWADDLSGIGYKLPTIGYLSSDKTEISMNAGDLQTLYDENGTKMTVSTYGISYPAVRVYSSSSDTTGTAVVNNNWKVRGPQFSSGDLSVSNLTGSIQTIQRIAFIK